jgi:hypothetical protein
MIALLVPVRVPGATAPLVRLVDDRVVPHPEVKVRPFGVSGAPDQSQGLALEYLLTLVDHHGPLLQMAVDGDGAIVVKDVHLVRGSAGIALVFLIEDPIPSEVHDTRRGRDHETAQVLVDEISDGEVVAPVAVIGRGEARLVQNGIAVRIKIDVTGRRPPVPHEHRVAHLHGGYGSSL